MAKPISKAAASKLALVGGETLLGRELREVLRNRATGATITEYSASGEGNFGEREGEAIYQEPLEAAGIGDARAILIAGSAKGALKAYGLAKAAGGHPVLIDCTGHLESRAEARIAAPLVEEADAGGSWLVVIAHPAAGALALTLTRLARYRRIRQSVAQIFEPASERGKQGISELQQQTTGLLSFKPLDKNVFDAQLSFNMLAQYGEEAPQKLSSVEQRIEKHVATILSRQNGTPVPMPSLRLMQAPVFHGYSISAWVEFESAIKTAELGEALASDRIEVRGESEEAPHSIGATGQSGLIVGDIRIDRNNARAAWFWIVCDNLRLTADGAADLVDRLGRNSR